MLAVCLLVAGLAGPIGAATTADSYPSTLQQAREALSRGDDPGAMALLDRALRLNPEGAEGFVLLGQAYRRLGRHEEAQAALRRAVALLGETTPAGQDALWELAASLEDVQKNDEAIETLRRVASLAPDRRGTHRDIGMIDLAIGRLEAATEEFRREIALHPAGDHDAALGSAYEGLGIAAYRSGDDDTALDALSKAPDTIEARYHLGLALARRGRHEEATAAFRSVLQREPDHRGALQNLARAAGALGLEDERRRALQRFEEIYRSEEDRRSLRRQVRDLRKRADEKIGAGDTAGAISAIEQAAALAPDDVDVQLDLGRLYARGGDASRSEQAYRRALQKDPLRAEAHYRLGRLLGDRGDLDGSVASLEQAARLGPMVLQYHVGLAQIYLRVHRAEDGVRELRLARRLAPDDPAGSFNLGLGLAQAGSLKEAATELESAVTLGYKDPMVHQALARVYLALGDADRSAKEQALFEELSGRGARP